MEYPTAYDLFCYDMVTGQRVRIIREDYEGLPINLTILLFCNIINILI